MKKLIMTIAITYCATSVAERHDFLLIGQSNMSGRGDFLQIGTINNSDKIYVYGNDGVWRQGVDRPVDDNLNQADKVSNDGKDAGLDSSYFFAAAMLEFYPVGDEVGLIPCAKGGLEINRFRKLYVKESMYTNCIKRAFEAGNIKGILFWQGEADAYSRANANLWTERFTRLISDIRQDLEGNVPVVFAQLNNLNPTNYPHWSFIRSEQARIYAGLNKIRMIDTSAIEFQADKVHATAQGYKDAGEMFASEMIDILTTNNTIK
jgi:hypothetical protein